MSAAAGICARPATRGRPARALEYLRQRLRRQAEIYCVLLTGRFERSAQALGRCPGAVDAAARSAAVHSVVLATENYAASSKDHSRRRKTAPYPSSRRRRRSPPAVSYRGVVVVVTSADAEQASTTWATHAMTRPRRPRSPSSRATPTPMTTPTTPRARPPARRASRTRSSWSTRAAPCARETLADAVFSCIARDVVTGELRDSTRIQRDAVSAKRRRRDERRSTNDERRTPRTVCVSSVARCWYPVMVMALTESAVAWGDGCYWGPRWTPRLALFAEDRALSLSTERERERANSRVIERSRGALMTEARTERSVDRIAREDAEEAERAVQTRQRRSDARPPRRDRGGGGGGGGGEGGRRRRRRRRE